MRVYLGVLGWREVRRSIEPGHWLWRDAFGWHDCSTREDSLCNAAAE